MSKEECDHHGIVHEWGFDKNKEFTAVKFICKHCNEVRDERFPQKEYITMIEHNATCDGTCDMCQARKIMISTGDANSNGGTIAANKQTEKELTAYSNARKHGIQPASTKMKDIQSAVRASDAVGFGVRV